MKMMFWLYKMLFCSLWEIKLLLQGFKLLKVAFLHSSEFFLLVCAGFKKKQKKIAHLGFWWLL